MSKVVIIVGPTAIGKSSLAIELAKKNNGEIINGDSVAVYKELNIGSAKITKEQMQSVEHYLLDYKEVNDDYSVAHFKNDGSKAIDEIEAKGKLPIIVGGTGLYIKALLYDYNFQNQESTNDDEYINYNIESLYQKLCEIDPKSAEAIHPNNRKRVIRALQIAKSGQTKSEIEDKQMHIPIYDNLIIGLTMNREKLKQRIDKRVEQMLQEGLVEEVKELFAKYGYDHHCFTAIGYKEFIPYFQNQCSLEDTIEQIKIHTRQFAKRQFTWFKNQMDVKWFDVEEENFIENIDKEIQEFLSE